MNKTKKQILGANFKKGRTLLVLLFFLIPLIIPIGGVKANGEPDCFDVDVDSYYAISEACVGGNNCNDNDARINPGAGEQCDSVDNDCDGQTDEGCPPVCGNGNVNPGETCDSDIRECWTFDGYHGSESCLDDCMGYDVCQQDEVCGDGITNGPEECDNSEGCDGSCICDTVNNYFSNNAGNCVYDDEIANVFTQISSDLANTGIANNLNQVNSGNVNSFSKLMFEREYGRITFNDAMDLSSSETQTFLQNLGTVLDMSGGRVSLEVLGSALEGKSAAISLLKLDELGIPADATPEQVYAHMIVKNDAGDVIDKSSLIDYDSISYVGACDGRETECYKFEFNAAHFTSYELDSTPPTTLTEGAPDNYTNQPVTITFNCDDHNGAGCSRVYYTSGGSIPTTDSSYTDADSNWRFTLTDDGNYIVKYFGVDNAGNQEDMTGQFNPGFIIDTILPAVSINSPTSNTYFSSKTISVDFIASDLNFNNVKVELYDASDDVVATQIVETSGENAVELIAPSDGVYSIKATAYDDAGNENSLSEFNLLVDTDNTITVGSENADYTTIQDAIDMAIDGNTISVASGTYSGLLNINKELKVVGAGAGLTLISHAPGAAADSVENLVTINSDNVIIDGFAIISENIDLKGIGSGSLNGMALNGHKNITILNNEIYSNDKGIYINTNSQPLAITEETSKNVNIENNFIHGNQDGIYIEAGEGIVVLKNKIYDNQLNAKTGLHNNADSVVDARKNWWGSADGPYEEAMNPSGVDGSIFGNIIFSSWCGNEACTEFATITVLSDNISDTLDSGILATSGDRDNSTNMSVGQELNILVSAGDNNSTVTLPAGTIITMADGTNINASALSAADVSESSLSGLGEGVVVDGALQWGIAGHGLVFSQPITLNIFVGTAYNGQTLDVVRSVSGMESWTTDGVSPTDCLVANGYCTFTATKASYYAATTTTAVAAAAPSGGGGGGGSFSCTTTWSCTSWNSCISGQQTRSCLLANPVCYAATAKPAETQSCTVEQPAAGQSVQEAASVAQPAAQSVIPTVSDVVPANQLTGNAVLTPEPNKVTGNVIALGPIRLSQTAAIVSGIVLLAVIAGLVFSFNFVKKKKISEGKEL